MDKLDARLAVLLLTAVCLSAVGPARCDPPRNEWYRHSVVNLHCDNHSGLLGKGVPPDDLTAMVAAMPVTMLQVSAQSNGFATYPTLVGLTNPAAQGYDTLATFRQIARAQGKKFCLYLSVDRRPLALKQHPEWAAIEADGKPSINSEPIVCQRPNRAKAGYLYEQFLPQIREVIARYDPDGLWFDGDYILTRPCWCPRCLAEWRAETGREAPREASSPDWARWLAWHRERYREYRRVVAETIHQASPRALYTSNWSWAWTPEPVPDFADTLSGDVGDLAGAVRTAQRWGAQATPWDLMSYAVPGERWLARRYSPQRTLQEGAVIMAHGGIWFLWPFGGDLPPYGVAAARDLARYARDRQAALGPSESLAQVAVLDSETTWRADGEPANAPRAADVARALAEAHYLTDVVNEQTWRAAADRYAVVLVPEHRLVAPETLAALHDFAAGGGTLLLTGAALRGDALRGDALRGDGDEPAPVAALLGVTRTPPPGPGLALLTIGQQHFALGDAWRLAPAEAQVRLKFNDGRPALVSRAVGRGTVALLAGTPRQYPDDGLLAAVLRALGRGPSYHLTGAGDAALLCTARRQPGRVVLHLCDLSARVGGAPADVDSAEYTDLNPLRRNVTVTLPWPAAPASVRGVPAGTLVSSTYRDGLLRLTFSTLQTHAAVILETDAARLPALLPADTPTEADAFHPTDNRLGMIFSDDFEADTVGQAPPPPWQPEIRGVTSIRVTADTAAGGRHSLAFVDAAGSSFWPYLHRSLTPLRHGTTRLSYDLRWEPAVESLMELRYEGKGPGPAVHIDGAGRITASGKPLGTLDPNVWHHFEIVFTLGAEQPTYAVTITSPGQAPRAFADLPYATEWFFRCDSVYFIGSGETPGRFFLDNVAMERLTAD
jgi:hypothetical protein